MMSPRRSSRARVAQIPTNASEHSSVSSSMASSRLDRNTRSNHRQEHNGRSTTTPHSTSSEEDMEGRSELETRQTRRKKREQDTHYERNTKVEEEVLEDEEGEEEEITRCICRKQEYPGPPVPLGDTGRSQQAKDSLSISLDLDNLPEDAGSLFIQCDDCKVWQHGGCVGIMDEAMSPDNYYCEECRKDLHRVTTGAKGQRYSRYLPVYEALSPKHLNTSAASKDSHSRSPKESDSKSTITNARIGVAKRRLTMNSRAALEEEEAIRKAIEESKSDGTSLILGNNSRKTKRVRDDSEEVRNDLKRRKTGSDSESPSNHITTSLAADSDNETSLSRSKLAGKRARGSTGANQTQRERDVREKEKEKGREREEVAGRRKGRADRRRGEEELEVPEESTRAGKANATATNVPSKNGKSQSAKSQHTIANGAATATNTANQRKNGRPTTRRGRLGRNQYTKDTLDKESPRPSHSRDSDDALNGGSDGHLGGGTQLNNGNKPSKPKHMNPNRTSMNDLRKRAAGILEYISRTKTEMDGETAPATNNNNSPNGSSSVRTGLSRVGSGSTHSTTSKLNLGLGDAGTQPTNSADNEGDDDSATAAQQQVETPKEASAAQRVHPITIDESEFKKLNSIQMMHVLQREITSWQTHYGKFGEKAAA